MGQIGTGFSIRQGFITDMSLDVCDRAWIREVRYEKRTIPGKDSSEEWIVNSLSGGNILNITEGCENINPGVSWHKFSDNLYYIKNNSQGEDGIKDVNSILYEINKSTGYIFRISHLFIGHGYYPDDVILNNGTLIYNENPESYVNILYHLRSFRTEDIKDLFIRVNGVYSNFSCIVDELICRINKLIKNNNE